MRQLVAGNWKMHTSRDGAGALARAIADGATAARHAELAVCPPFPYLASVAKVLAGSQVVLGAQDAHFEPSGAFTGEVSMAMLADLGCKMVIVGHSERRRLFFESDELIRRKVIAALSHSITPIVCVGETEAEREDGLTDAVLERQLVGGLDPGELGARRFEVAYEPVWAIGTGRTATPPMVAAAHRRIRETLTKLVGRDRASQTRILYGGSVKPGNAAELLAIDGVDGALVGGASLDAESFLAIAAAARR